MSDIEIFAVQDGWTEGQASGCSNMNGYQTFHMLLIKLYESESPIGISCTLVTLHKSQGHSNLVYN